MIRRLLPVLLTTLLMGLSACGSSDEDTDDLELACRAQCDRLRTAEDCDGLDLVEYAEGCKADCSAFASAAGEACREESLALMRCRAEADYVCVTLGESSDLFPATGDCTSEEAALNGCQG